MNILCHSQVAIEPLLFKWISAFCCKRKMSSLSHTEHLFFTVWKGILEMLSCWVQLFNHWIHALWLIMSHVSQSMFQPAVEIIIYLQIGIIIYLRMGRITAHIWQMNKPRIHRKYVPLSESALYNQACISVRIVYLVSRNFHIREFITFNEKNRCKYLGLDYYHRFITGFVISLIYTVLL